MTKKVELDETEIAHIEMALIKMYKDEWCLCCERIAKKLGFTLPEKKGVVEK